MTMSASLKRKSVKFDCGTPVIIADPPDGPVMAGWPFVATVPAEYVAADGVTPLQ